MARTSAVALAAPNVVAFPNAVARKVDNYRFAEQRRAVLAARKDSPLCARYLSHQEREADRLAQELSGIEQTPALLIVSAILRTMDADQYMRVVEQLAPGAAAGSPPAKQAIATIQASRLSTGKQFDLFRAFDRMRGEG